MNELLRNPTNPRDPMDPTNSYKFLRILKSSLDSNYYCVYRGTSGPTYSDALNLKFASFNELV